MPKVSWLKKQEDPPIDFLMAAILERKHSFRISNEDIADLIGVKLITVQRMMRQSPWAWKQDYRNQIVKHLRIPDDVITMAYEKYIRDLARYV